jgi:putative endonuclease
MSTDRRRSLGARGEQIAAEHLAARGYQVIERNFRTRLGELDLVAVGPGALVFCEVKTRVSTRPLPSLALEAIGPAKRAKLRLLAREWLRMRPAASGRPTRERLRFDAIGVTVSIRGDLLALEHVEDAFS